LDVIDGASKIYSDGISIQPSINRKIRMAFTLCKTYDTMLSFIDMRELILATKGILSISTFLYYFSL